MLLKDIFTDINLHDELKNIDVSYLSRDTRDCKDNSIFFIIDGSNDVFSFIKNVVELVSIFVAASKDKEKFDSLNLEKPVIFVDDIEDEFRRVVGLFYPVDLEKFTFIGVTGTNGKTTTTKAIYYCLQTVGKKAALIGTVCNIIDGKELASTHTTPDYLALHKILFSCKQNQVTHVVMEVSSHGIDQKRVDGINFSQCIFTNLSRDHLDYHNDMESYFNVKKSLFENNSNAIMIINSDDQYGKRLCNDFKNCLSYGLGKENSFCISDIDCKHKKTHFSLTYNDQRVSCKTPLLGKFNIYNLTASIASLVGLGFSLEKAADVVSTFKGVEGRLEKVSGNIFIDYAHTPDAFENVLEAIKEIGYSNVVVVFGCGGNRDKGKRIIMGQIACKNALFSVITADNPRNENLDIICKEISKGFSSDNFVIEKDRAEAIKIALDFADKKKNCAVLIAGKGHEDYQVIGDKKIPFSDKQTVREILGDNI